MAKYLVIVAALIGVALANPTANPTAFPGTSWCGEDADNATMKCCQEHAKCPTIPPFKERYEIYNKLPVSIYECSCESRFYLCLKDAPLKKSLHRFLDMEAEHSPCFNLVKKHVCLATSWLDWFGFGCQKYGDMLVGEINWLKNLLKDLIPKKKQ